MNEIVVNESFTPEQVDLIKKTVAVGSTTDELKLFLTVAKRSGLDPFTKQIHFVKRGGRVTIQTGIDGYRAIAERTGTLAGIDDAVFDTETEQHPKKASVTVYRIVGEMKVPFTASARWAEYVPQGGQDFMWKKMPYLMLGKVAESLALRKAFPNDLSGLYTNEEMAQAQGYDTTPVEENAPVIVAGADEATPPPKSKVSKGANEVNKQKKEIQKLCDEMTLIPLEGADEYKQYVLQQTDLTLEEKNYAAIIATLTKIKNGEHEEN